MPTTDITNRRRRSKAEVQARAAEALDHWIAGATYKEIASQLGYGFEANAHRAVQQAYDALPEAVNSAQLRKIQNLRLNAIWWMAYLAARDGDVPAMRVLLEVCRRRLRGAFPPGLMYRCPADPACTGSYWLHVLGNPRRGNIDVVGSSLAVNDYYRPSVGSTFRSCRNDDDLLAGCRAVRPSSTGMLRGMESQGRVQLSTTALAQQKA